MWAPLINPCVCAQTEYAKRTGYKVTAGGTAGVYYVQDMNTADAKEYEVNLNKPDCCHYVRMHLQPCQHMVPVFVKRDMFATRRATMKTIKQFWPKWALAMECLKHYTGKSVRRPAMYSGPFVGDDADRLVRPVQKPRKRGRPKRNRYVWKKTTAKSVAEQLPTVYNPDFGVATQFV